MRVLHSTCAAVVLIAAALAAQTPPRSAPEGYTIFLRGTPVGREEITVRTDATGTTITSQSRTSAPSNMALDLVETRYSVQGSPQSFELRGKVNGGDLLLRTTFKDGAATTEGSQQGKAVSGTQKVSPQAIVITNGVFSGFAALPPVLSRAAAGHEFRVFLIPSTEIAARLAAIANERMQTGTSLFDVRRYELVLSEPAGDLVVHVTTSLDGLLLRVNIPAQGVDFVRNDLAGVASRTDVYSNPGDRAVLIPAPGFSLGGTLTLPPGAETTPASGREPDRNSTARFPAVVLVNGSTAPDRDSLAAGVPGMAQLAGAIAEAGFSVVRFDRRGSGQSGGRAESATLTDYAEDVRTVVRWLADRKDIDPKRIAVIGHGDGAWKALLAASKEKRVAAVASLAAPGTTGAELVLEQQQLQLDAANVPEADRPAKVALQKQIASAVLTGKGWEQISPDVRRQADTPWFQSLLAYDPAKVVDDVEVPVLIVHGELDREIPVAHAERLAAIARKGESVSVELVTVRGVNHLLIPAFTGAVSEYGTLADRTISKDVTSAVTAWLAKSLPASRAR